MKRKRNAVKADHDNPVWTKATFARAREYRHMQATTYKSQCLKSLFAIRATQVLYDQRADPFEFSSLFERNSPRSKIVFSWQRQD